MNGPSAELGQRRRPAAPRLEAAAREAGFDDVAAYLRHRYVVDRRSAREIGEEAGVSDMIVRRQLALLGVAVRRGAHRFYSDRRAARLEDPVQALIDRGPPAGFDSWNAYFATRRRSCSRLRITEIATELEVSLWHAQRLAARFDPLVAYYFRPFRFGESSRVSGETAGG